MREFERMKEGSSVETTPCGCRRHESTRNDRSPVRKILVRRHVLLQLDGGGVPSDCHFLNTWRPSLLFGSPEAGAVESFSVTRSRISRANDRVGYLRAQFARPVERYRVAWPVRRVLTWVFSRVCARFSCSSSIRERVCHWQPACSRIAIFALPYQTEVHRRFPNQKTRGCRSSGSDLL